VFRDVLDIPPGEDFVSAIRNTLAGSRSVLVLIGPRWLGTGTDGQRRIDDPNDFVRIEVQVALENAAQLVPVLLPGARMPSEDELPEALKPLARRNAMSLGDTHWDADIDRLVGHLGERRPRAVWPWALGSALLAAALVGGWCALRSPPVPAAAADASDRLLGSWQAEVRYDWGDRYRERFDFKRHAGQLTGTASFLAYPRAIENLQLDGNNLHFQTRSMQSVGSSDKEVTRSYAAELRGAGDAPVLVFRMQSSGGHSSSKPIEFEARRIEPGYAAPPMQIRR
jgi:hypothetical protein